jgi:hypothetical protein
MASGTPPLADQVERCIHGGATQVRFRMVKRLRGKVARRQAKKYRLQDVFCVRAIAHKPICGPIHHAVMILEQSFQV